MRIMSLGSLKWRIALVITVLCAVLVGLAGGCIQSNTSPVIMSLDAEKAVLVAGERSGVRVIAYDSDGDDISYEWTVEGGDISGQGAAVTWTAPNGDDSYLVTVKVIDGQGGETEIQTSFDVVLNNSPVVKSLTTERPIANRRDYVVIECTASDADLDDLTYNWSADAGEFYGSGPVVTWKTPSVLGSYRINVAVTDGWGGEASSHLDVAVETNHAPVINYLNSELMTVNYGNSTTITCGASDPDGNELSYEWSAAEGEISGEGNSIVWTAPDMCGEYILISVSVFDDRDAAADADISIRVKKPG